MSESTETRRIVIAGGSGFLGTAAAWFLVNEGVSVVVMSRRRPNVVGPWRHVTWDARSSGEWVRELDGADGLINLAGRSVDCIKTPDRKDEILRSRVESVRALGAAMRAVKAPPPVWVQMSTAHIYGDPPSVVCNESTCLGTGFAPEVGQAWEAELKASALPCQRKVVLRTSFVLGRDRGAGQGALARLALLARMGLGGRCGSGDQGVSWIHERDLNRLFERALFNPAMKGAYVASSPRPVSQRVFMSALRRAVGMPCGLPTPAWLVQVGARILFRTDAELALYGRYVASARLAREGFDFEFPNLDEALADLFDRTASPSRSARLRAGPQRYPESSPSERSTR